MTGCVTTENATVSAGTSTNGQGRKSFIVQRKSRVRKRR